MIKTWFSTYIKVSKKEALYSSVKILGLALGFAAAFLILIWLSNEFDYDSFHKNHENIYRVVSINNDNGQKSIYTPSNLTKFAIDELPELENASRYYNEAPATIIYNTVKKKSPLAFVDKSFFDIFSFELEDGDIEKTFSERNTIILTKKLADVLFEGKTPIGEFVTMFSGRKYKVTGVLSPVNENTHFQFGAVLPRAGSYMADSWNTKWNISYFKVKSGVDKKHLAKKINQLVSPKVDGREKYTLQNIQDIYLKSEFDELSVSKSGNYNLIVIFILALILIIFIISVNYLNLTILSGVKRNTELGVRNILGAKKHHLLIQFSFETFLNILIALLFSSIIIIVSIAYIQPVFPKELFAKYWHQSLRIILSVLLMLGLATSIYQAIYFKAQNTIQLLKGKTNSNIPVRKLFLGIQLVISFVVLVFAINTNRQVNYIRNFDLGLDIDNVIEIPISYYQSGKLKERLSQIPGVENVSVSTCSPVNFLNQTDIKLPGAKKSKLPAVKFSVNCIDENFISLFDINIVEGNNFKQIDENRAYQTNKCIINKTAANILGYKQPIGKLLSLGEKNTLEITGLIDDFNFKPLSDAVQPLVLVQNTEGYYLLHVKINPKIAKEVLPKIELCYNGVLGNKYIFEYNYLSDKYKQLYKNEVFMADCFFYFAIICLLLSLFGFFSISSFVLKTKEKEVAVRKVFGASKNLITKHYLKDLSKTVLFSLLIAVPLSIYLSYTWLQNYAHQINIGVVNMLMYVLAFFLLMLIILVQRAQVLSKLEPNKIIKNE